MVRSKEELEQLIQSAQQRAAYQNEGYARKDTDGRSESLIQQMEAELLAQAYRNDSR